MTVNETPRPQHPVAPPQRSILVRSALVAGGATTGLLASALAGFGLVGLMFPNAGLPGTGSAALSAAVYMPAPVTVTVMPETQVARYQPAPAFPAPRQIAPAERSVTAPAPTPLAPAQRETRRVIDREAPAETAAVPAPAAIAAAPAPIAGPETRPVIASKSVASVQPPLGEIDRSGFGPRIAALATIEDHGARTAPETGDFGPRIAALPPMAEAAPGSLPAEPEDFAMLADDDAAARAGAGLFAAPATAVDPSAASATAAEPDISPVRPAPRPEDLAEQVAAATPAAASGALLTSIRPAPRPEIRRAAAPAPAAAAAPVRAAAAAPAEIAAPTGIVEVAAKRKPGGFMSGGSSSCGRTLARAMPSRRGGPAGSEFFAGLTGVSGPDRDARAIAELARGNMPSFLQVLAPVTFRGQDGRGAQVEITICVTPDYLALGSDKDYVRVPLGLPAAARIAGAFDMTLPTPRMVDAIYAQANVKLSPAPMTPGAQMSSTGYFVTHNATIEKQLGGRRGLVGGHKKDVVMANRMASAPGRVAIYGWHQSNGAPIQPVSTVHGANYADYSHGIRLVSKTAYLNGKAVSLDDLLASSRYAHLLNSDGPMPGPVIRVASN